VEKRFRALRFIRTLLKVLAWITLVGSVIAALVFVIGGAASSIGDLTSSLGIEGALVGIMGGLGAIIVGLVYFLVFYAWAEAVYVVLAIEENTRLTAMALSGRASG